MTKKNKRIKIPNSKRNFIACKQKWQCRMCKELLPPIFEIDHITPLWKGGSNRFSSIESFNNLQALCGGCHSKKSINDWYEYLEWKREQHTGISRFKDPMSICYQPDEQEEREEKDEVISPYFQKGTSEYQSIQVSRDIETFFEQFRHKSNG